MTGLKICFINYSELTSDQQKESDALDKLAFAGESEADHPELSGITWASHDWMALGFLGEELVTQLSLPIREISVGAEKIWVAGVGGVATHPKFQHKGYASALLGAIQVFIRDKIRVTFGLLICADQLRRFYERAGWQFAADNLYFSQDNQRRALHTCVMVLPLANHSWPKGEIDLCGSPW
jgi:GNAT superfamily N-acetyltransferase